MHTGPFELFSICLNAGCISCQLSEGGGQRNARTSTLRFMCTLGFSNSRVSYMGFVVSTSSKMFWGEIGLVGSDDLGSIPRTHMIPV